MRRIGFLVAFSVLASARPAAACGCSIPAGSEGDGKDTGFYTDLAASFSQLSSFLAFEGTDADLAERTVVGTLGFRFGDGWAIRLSGGGLLDGSLDYDGRAFDLDGGWLVGLTLANRVVRSEHGVPFVDAAITLSAAGSHTTERGVAGGPERGWMAYDLRFGVTLGWTLWDVLTPHVAFRGFAGAAVWDPDGDTMAGTDRSHVQLGAGATLHIPGNVSLYVEYVPLFERALSTGVSLVL